MKLGLILREQKLAYGAGERFFGDKRRHEDGIYLARLYKVGSETLRILLSVQILRAIAAWYVVFDHALLADTSPHKVDPHIAWVIGSMGVFAFFVVSGLLMIETSYQDFGSALNARRFLVKRLIRIAPLYWAFTGIVFFMSVAGGHAFPGSEMLLSLLFIPFQNGSEMRPLLGVGWTLNYEMYFYFLFAIAMAAPRRFGLLALFGLFAAVLGLGFTQKSLFDTSDPINVLQFWTSPLILLFPTGCLIGLARGALVSSGPLPKLPISPALLCCALLAAGALAVIALAPGAIYPMSFGRQVVMWGVAALAVAICALTANPPNGAVNRWLVLCGNASYSTYLSHLLVIRFMERVLGATAGQAHPALVIALILIVATLVGIVVHKWVEKPLLALFAPKSSLRRVFRRTSAARA